MPFHEQVGESRQHLQLAAFLDHSPQPVLLNAKLSFSHAKRMLHFGEHVCLAVSIRSSPVPVNVRNDDAPAAIHVAITNVAGVMSFPEGAGGLIQTTSC